MIANALAGLRAAVIGPDRAPARRRPDGLLWPLLALLAAAYVLAGLDEIRIDVASPLVRAALAVAAAGPWRWCTAAQSSRGVSRPSPPW
ncbi:MAG: hypothetical protein ABW022_17890 [Actinoplanes sp.]